MKQVVSSVVGRLVVVSLLLCAAAALQASDVDLLDRMIKITDTKGTRYQLLKQVSQQSGYFFIYDSQLVNNNEVVKIRKGEYTIRNAIYAITGNNQLEISIVGRHILFNLPTPHNLTSNLQQTNARRFFTIRGVVYDHASQEAIPYVTVSINDAIMGTVTNQNGEFKITIPDSLRQSVVKLSHVGYESVTFQASSLRDKYMEFLLEPKIISLQEVVVRAVNPLHVMQDMLSEREHNYSSVPVYLTTFYREVIEHKKKNIDLTEAVLKVYKTSYQKTNATDQVKLIKMRHVLKKQESDTIFTKMRSGISSCLILDVMRNLPDFLTPKNGETPYVYAYTDMSVVDNRRVYVISFEQKKEVKEPLYKGQLFIDAENYALLEAHFDVNPAYVAKATDMFVEKKSRDFNLTLRRVSYTVSYKPSGDSIYYVNHVRGDLEFKVKRKRHFFSSALNLWFEMVNCKVDRENIKRFPRDERLSTRTVFSETKYKYDADFWEHFNVIVPEEELKELIMNNLGEVTPTPALGEADEEE
ncbi:carboxypeptidase-like regulatory domain-containing protein [uncultured Bacteroides sp.]|uniref:carboxypeptidase-like regulatory domain-containing protein n=1 Tax=uncultured Bacteroides sp. TaxID=162156 RepID=UPI002AA844FE|nr:carboxypeptidase-like regulatory domain-containing protein [uncultured Bacteroides sp.]